MIELSKLYPPPKPNPHGPVFLSEFAWQEAIEFSNAYLIWPPDSDHDQEVALKVQDFLRQFYTGAYFTRSKWFRDTPKHSALVLCNTNGYQLRQISTLCSDGVVLVGFGETYGDTVYGLDDSYFARRLTEEMLISDPGAFSRAIS